MSRSSEWLAEVHGADQRRFLTFVAGSFVAHCLLVALAALAPPSRHSAMPEVLRVDLVSLPSAPSAPKATRRAKPAPAAQPAPRPQQKQVVLPKRAPAAVPKKPRRVAPPPGRPEPIAYDDALSQLRAELGEETPVEPTAEPTRTAEPAEAAAGSAGDAAGRAGEAAAQAWHGAVIRHLRSCWVTPPEFLNRALSTGLEVRLTTTGAVLGEPSVTHRSGDPFFDDNAARAVMRCAPLPAPPAAGSWRFAFTSETR